jgi:hypothetical protein
MLFEKVTIMELKLVTWQQLYDNNAQRETTLTYKKILYRRLSSSYIMITLLTFKMLTLTYNWMNSVVVQTSDS